LLRVGIDVGGTFTDLFAFDRDTGEVRTAKVLTTKANLVDGVFGALKAANIEPSQMLEFIGQGSTTATNALIERSFPPTALITTDGFRDTIEIGRQRRAHLYDPYQVKERPLIPRRMRFAVDERLSAQGEVVRPLDRTRTKAAVERALALGAQSFAVAFINAYADGRHEREARDLIAETAPGVPVAISSETRPVFRELGRFTTTVIRAALLPVMASYFERLEQALRQRGFTGTLTIIKSNGGTMAVQAAKDRPEELLESGPAGGVAYAALLSRTVARRPNIIHTDMGGTSFDVSVVEDGAGLITHEHDLGWDVPLITPMLDIRSVGSGGGSIAWIDGGGSLRVGPRSAGSEPGPVCYGRGGTEATVTDANLVLGRLEATLGGKFDLDTEAARGAVAAVGERVGLDPVAAAEGIVAICNENMAQAIRAALADRGRDPRDFALASFGGAGGMHACWIARSLGIPVVIVPAYAGVASAFGATQMDIRYDIERFYYKPLHDADPAEVECEFGELEREGAELIGREGLSADAIRFERTAQMRYEGQSYEVLTPLDNGPIAALEPIAKSFHDAHLREYGVASEDFAPAFVSLGVAAIGAVPHFRPAPQRSDEAVARLPVKGERPVVFDGAARPTPVYDARQLIPGARIDGPAVLEHAHSCTVLPPGSFAVIDSESNLLVTV
jgi:N-methylhydantoinase A